MLVTHTDKLNDNHPPFPFLARRGLHKHAASILLTKKTELERNQEGFSTFAFFGIATRNESYTESLIRCNTLSNINVYLERGL